MTEEGPQKDNKEKVEQQEDKQGTEDKEVAIDKAEEKGKIEGGAST